jgi:hypothetical protein
MQLRYGLSTPHNCGEQVVIKDMRKSNRQRQFWRGFVRLPQTHKTIDCIVRDISETGAKLRLRCTTPMPEFFELHIPSKRQFAKSKLVWNRNCEVGISFESPGAFGSLVSSDGELSARMGRLEVEIAALKKMLNPTSKAG